MSTKQKTRAQYLANSLPFLREMLEAKRRKRFKETLVQGFCSA